MDESEANMSSDSKKMTLSSDKPKPKKRSLVERELETSLTARVTSPAPTDGSSISRYGRARRAKTDTDFCMENAITTPLKSPKFDKTPIKSPTAYKMHASNSPVRVESALQNQIENIYTANISLSRFGTEDKPGKSPSPVAKKFPKTYVKTDLTQTKEKDETLMLIKNMFSPNKPAYNPKSRMSTVLDRSSEKCGLNGNMSKQQNGYADKASIVKTLDFDSKQKSKNKDISIIKTLDFESKSKRKDRETTTVMSKSELFDLEAKCEYQVGDLAWARMGTYPFWPCIITREPESNMFVKKKLFGRIERNLINVTFFGDNGRRSWILETMLRKFQGLREFETTRDQFKPEDKKKDHRLYAAFFISDKKQALWLKSVEEAETFMKEPKRLRIDIFYDLLEKIRTKQNQKSQKKVTRADSDVSLSESLLDTLFSEDDAKSDDPDRARKKRTSLDVSEVVTACLDNMAARTGLTQIQKQSHMDRWLQKAKSKTPEKSHLEITITVEKVDDAKEKVMINEKRIIKDDDKNKKKVVSNTVPQKPYSLRKSTGESHLLLIHNEHDYSAKFNVENCYVKLENIPLNDKVVCKSTPINEITETRDKINDNENSLHSFINGVVDVQLEPDISNKIVIEEVLKMKKYDTDKTNVSSSETDIESSCINNRLTRAIGNTSNNIGDENAQDNFTNRVAIDQTALETTNIFFAEEVKITNNDVTFNENLSTSETDVNISFNAKESNQGSDVDNCGKITISSEPVTETNPNQDHIEFSTIESISDSNNFTKNVVSNNSNDQADDIPSSSINQTEQIMKENIFQNPSTEQNANKDLTENSDHEMSCDDETIDCNTKEPSINDQLISDLTIQETNKKEEKTDKNDDPIIDLLIHEAKKENVKRKEHKNEIDTENVAEGIQAETLKIDQNMTEKYSIKSLSPDLKDQLSNDIECSIRKPYDKMKDITEKDVIHDASFSMLSETGVIEKDKNESEKQTEVTMRNVSDKTVESLTGSNDENTLKRKDDLESEIQRNGLESVGRENSKSDVQVDLLSKLKTKCLESEVTIDLSSESEKNYLEFETKRNYVHHRKKSKDSKSKITENVKESEPKHQNFKSELKIYELKSEIKDNAIHEQRNIKFAKVGISSALIEDCSVVVVPLNGPTLNGYRENRVKDINEEVTTESDTASTNSEFDDLSLIELKKRTIAKTRTRRNFILNIQKSNENLIETREINSQSPLPKIVNVSTGEIKINGKNETEFERDETVVTKRVLRPRIDTPVESLNPSKESSPDRRIQEEIDYETVSITSEGSSASIKRRGRAKDKESDEDKMKDPEFVRYLELRQDTLIDEHPELLHEEIVEYLYKTWLYEQSCKSDIVKNHDKEQSNLVKGINSDGPIVKKKKRAKQDKIKLINIDKVFKKELIEEFATIPPKDKPKRQTAQPCYAEDYSDIEDEIKMFEIFKNQKEKAKTPQIIQQKDVTCSSGVKEETVKEKEETVEEKEEISPEEYYDEVEAYFEELTKPKPNIFKGLVREKVCEICEKTSNLVKCKGCNGMFHIECIKKEVDIVDVPVSTRRKKKKKPRGRRPKSSTDSNGLDESHSDEKSQDVSVSEENKSVDEIRNESHIVVADVDNFEAQLAAKMKEMIEVEDKIDYDSYSSDDCLDWRHTIAGKCEIVDVKLKPKKPEIDVTNFKCNNCQKDDVPLCFVCKSPVSPKSQINHRQKCQVAHCHKFYHIECLEYWPQTQFNTIDPSKIKGNVNGHYEALTCPRHVCHTCVCDDPRGCKTRFSGDKLARCVRCPATYHSFTKCLPAGTQILTASHIICPRHYEHRPGKVPCHVNTGWCFICAQGGTLICCEYCPTSFHAECLQIDPPDGGYMCEDCETGRLPLYGEMVWVKLGHYRWWPGIVLHPHQIPPNILAVRHSPGEFVVRFFGQYDHYWVNRGRVFPYQEGDSGRISSQKSKIDEAFTVAMEHAQRAYEILKTLEENEEESPDIASSLLPPHYVKLKINKPYGSVMIKREEEESSLTQCECDPNDLQPCGPASHCLNRMLLTECGPSCRAGDRCNNRAFERREYPRLTAYRTKHRGWGLKALEDIKAGQFVIEYVGELIDEEEFRRRMRRKHEIRDENFYFLTLDKERMIDAGPKGNLARFMNHCCEPNCETQKWTVLGDIRVGLFALRDIPANSELTFNYNLECAGIEKKRCMCGAKRCSGYIGAKPKQEEKETHKKPKVPTKRPYKKRKTEDMANEKNKPKRPIGRPPKPRELTEIEKDLLIIKNATNGISSDSECSGRLSSVDTESERKDIKAPKRKRVSFSSEDIDSKRMKFDEDKTSSEID